MFVFTYRANIIYTSFTHLHVIHVSHYMYICTCTCIYTCTWYMYKSVTQPWFNTSQLHNLGLVAIMIYMSLGLRPWSCKLVTQPWFSTVSYIASVRSLMIYMYMSFGLWRRSLGHVNLVATYVYNSVCTCSLYRNASCALGDCLTSRP